MDIRNVLIIGGSGFLGSHLAHVFCTRDLRVTVPTRRRERAKHLLPLPTVEVVEADVHDPQQLAQLMEGQQAVVNLVGVLHSRRGSPYGADFAAAHVELPKKIVAACKASGVGRLLHVSALKADRGGPSAYLRSKADGEAAIREAGSGIAWTIFQPSVVFGPGDSFLNMFADLARSFPVLPLACPDARFQPVYVEDVGRALGEALADERCAGKTYELCGPKVYTLRQMVQYAARLAGCPRPIIGLSQGLSYLQAAMLEFAPGGMMSRDNIDSMKVDNVCGNCALPDYLGPGLQPTALEAVAPNFIGAHVPRARYSPFRSRARR
jgi:NADH dehydrogenase